MKLEKLLRPLLLIAAVTALAACSPIPDLPGPIGIPGI